MILGGGPFYYPKGLPIKAQLQYYASQFEAAELNGVFYRTPTPGLPSKSWKEQTDKNFVFTWKASKFITPHPHRNRQQCEPCRQSQGPKGRCAASHVAPQAKAWLGVAGRATRPRYHGRMVRVGLARHPDRLFPLAEAFFRTLDFTIDAQGPSAIFPFELGVAISR